MTQLQIFIGFFPFRSVFFLPLVEFEVVAFGIAVASHWMAERREVSSAP